MKKVSLMLFALAAIAIPVRAGDTDASDYNFSPCPIGTHPTGIWDEGGAQCVSDQPASIEYEWDGTTKCEFESEMGEVCRPVYSGVKPEGGFGGSGTKPAEEQAP
ncbi:MAG: hypothetical protein HY549_03465 [Elusimicrobia bacterium]|nr:hypothetical protein [Elusimicrobiota bacterium]